MLGGNLAGRLTNPPFVGRSSVRRVAGTMDTKVGALKINADLTLPATSIPAELEWRSSPAKGVWRRMLDRDGDEVARCTTIVKFDSKTSFPAHTHDGGEEFLVLEGTFSDPLTGPCPRGFYVRNPIGSSHEPWTEADGTVILVKLWQMTDPTEPHVFLDTQKFYEEADKSQPITRMQLFSNEKTKELVGMEWWKPGVSRNLFEHFSGSKTGGVEGLLIGGDLEVQGKSYQDMWWFRFPSTEAAGGLEVSTKEGCQMWIKTGHLP